MPSVLTDSLTPEALVFLEAIMLKANAVLQKSGSYLHPHPTQPNTFIHGQVDQDPILTFTVMHYGDKTSMFTAESTNEVFWFSTTDCVLEILGWILK